MFSILQEYEELIEQKESIEAQLASLPTGYISKKSINGKIYYYLQHREGGQLTSRYLKPEQIDTVSEQITERKTFEEALPQIKQRLRELEQAAAILGKGLDRELMLIRLSAGMDALEPAEKKQCTEFANAMNAIEGVPVSAQTANDIAAWHNGSKSYISVFEGVLRRYGFPVEVQ